jgi:hypothetical protein
MVGDEISILRRKLVKSESLAIRDARRVRGAAQWVRVSI